MSEVSRNAHAYTIQEENSTTYCTPCSPITTGSSTTCVQTQPTPRISNSGFPGCNVARLAGAGGRLPRTLPKTSIDFTRGNRASGS